MTQPDDGALFPASSVFSELWDELFEHRLKHFACPACGVRLGLEDSEWRFIEQTRATFWCPRGHTLTLRLPDAPDGEVT